MVGSHIVDECGEIVDLPYNFDNLYRQVSQ
jgi:hypothetical protein